MKHLGLMTLNLQGASTRYEQLDGKQYLVVPAVALGEGVHSGSEGPLYYPQNEIDKFPWSWNSKPFVLEHPVVNGEGVSACQPSILAAQGLGFIMNGRTEGGQLKMEAWTDEDKWRKVHPGSLEEIKKGNMVEVSTGLYHDTHEAPGTWNGQSYVGTVHNIVPDHLALLPDRTGAYSVNKGGGLLRNAEKTAETGPSFDDIREQIRGLLRESKAKPFSTDSDLYCWVQDVFPKFAIYECKDKSYKIGYKLKAGKVALDGEPEEVRKVTSYVTVNGEVGMPTRPVYITNNGQVLVNEDMQGPIRSIPKPHSGELDDVHKKNQFQKSLELHYAGVQQEGDWGGWVTDIFANYVVWSKDGKLFRLPYTYDDDKIRFDVGAEAEEVERVSEYRRKTPLDGTSSPYSVNSASTKMVTQNQLATLNRLLTLAQQGRLTDNVIHQGAHELLHDGTGTPSAHQHPDSGKGDTQTRSTVGRKEQVSSMIASGGWKEEDRTFLEGLPDDHFQRVDSFTKRGAAQPIVPYSYAGIGDRSSVHSPQAAVQNSQQPIPQQIPAPAPNQNADSYVRSLPANVWQTLHRRSALIQAITSNAANKFNPEYLAAQPIEFLEQIAAFAIAAQQPATPPRQPLTNQQTANFAGQGEAIPMFLNNGQQQQQSTTQNAVDPTINANGDQILQLPDWGRDDTKQTA
jgi:hypothetical protein